jgi:hypothetical protein
VSVACEYFVYPRKAALSGTRVALANKFVDEIGGNTVDLENDSAPGARVCG